MKMYKKLFCVILQGFALLPTIAIRGSIEGAFLKAFCILFSILACVWIGYCLHKKLTIIAALAEVGYKKTLRKLLLDPVVKVHPDALLRRCERFADEKKIPALETIAECVKDLRHVAFTDIYDLILDVYRVNTFPLEERQPSIVETNWVKLKKYNQRPLAISTQKNNYVINRKMVDVPQFERPIGNHTFHIGREAVLGCSIINLGKHKVGWLRAEDQTVLSLHERVVLGPRYSINLDSPSTWQLKIRPLKAEDRGCYMCQINTQPSMKWQIGCIDVYVPPDIINEETSADVSAQELDNVTLSCKATGHPPPKITWRKEDHEPMMLKKLGGRDFYKVESYVGSSLPLWRVDRRQMGAFLCIASNDVPPAVSKRVILNVNFPPTVIVPNQLLGAPLGTDVVLECTVEAYPNTINYWLKNRGEMLLDGPKYIISEERSSYKVVMKLTIRMFLKNDIGTYNCVSTNSLGKSEGTLRLYEIKLYPSSQSAAEVNVGGLTEGAVKQKTPHNTANNLKKLIDVFLLIVIVIIL